MATTQVANLLRAFNPVRAEIMENGKITRQHLIETLRELSSDEYDAEDLVGLTDAELIQKIVDCVREHLLTDNIYLVYLLQRVMERF